MIFPSVKSFFFKAESFCKLAATSSINRLKPSGSSSFPPNESEALRGPCGTNMATAARVTIAEVEHLVEPGEIDPDHVVTPGIFVRHILKGEKYERRIEKRTTRR